MYNVSENSKYPDITVSLLEETEREPAESFNLDWMNNAIYLIKS